MMRQHWLDRDHEHTHRAIDDARGHAHLLETLLIDTDPEIVK